MNKRQAKKKFKKQFGVTPSYVIWLRRRLSVEIQKAMLRARPYTPDFSEPFIIQKGIEDAENK